MVHAIKNKLSKKTVKMIKTSSTFFLEKVYNLHSIFWVFQSWFKSDKRRTATKVFPNRLDSIQIHSS